MAYSALPRSFVPHLPRDVPPAPAATVPPPVPLVDSMTDATLRGRLVQHQQSARYYDAAEAGQWSREREDREHNARLLAAYTAEALRRGLPVEG